MTKKIAYSRFKKVVGAESKTCHTCKGNGRVVQQVSTPFGVMQSQGVCPTCGGSGKIYTKDGKELTNGGLEKVKDTLEVKIPAGIKPGAYIKFAGNGNESSAHHVGDLYIQINIV